MISNSNINDSFGKEYNGEKRIDKRVDFDYPIYYPIINNQSMHKNFDNGMPIIRAINISESGICFESRVSLKAGDFISFTLQLKDNPSWWCLAEVKWVTVKGLNYLLGCSFFLMNYDNVKIIRNFIREN